MVEFSRRKFLALTASGALSAALAGSVFGSRFMEAFDSQPIPNFRGKQPRLKDLLKPNPFLLAAAPHKNIYNNSCDFFHLINFFYGVKEMREPEKIQVLKKTLENNKKVIISSNPPANLIDGRFSFKRDLKTYLEQLFTFLQSLSPFQAQIALNFGYEMNGPWTIYGPSINSPEEFKEAYKEIYNTVKNKYPETTMLWCPNTKYPIEGYFPGEEYIDWAGLNGYNKHRNLPHPGWYNPDTSFNDLFANDVALLQKLTSKPIFLVETNSARGGNFRVEWFKTAVETASRWNQVIGVGGFFWNKASLFDLDPNETNWSVTTDLEMWNNFRNRVLSNPIVTPNIVKI